MIKRLLNEMSGKKICYAMIAPFMLLFFAFTLLPVVMSVFLSFTSFNLLQAPNFVFLDNYMRLFLNDDVFSVAVRNTLILALIVGPVSYLLCFLLAWMINDFNPKLRAVLTVIFYAPSISGAVYMIWSLLFAGDSYGLINNFLLQTGILRDPVLWLEDPRYMLGVVIIVSLWLSIGTSFLAFIAGLQGVDTSLYEAGAVDGIRNRWQELWFITLPSMRPQLMFGAVIQITAAFGVSDVTVNLVGFPSVDYAAHTVGNHILDYGTTRFELGYSSAIATILFVAMITVNKLVQGMLRKVGS